MSPIKENFSVSDLNPMNKIKSIAIFLVKWFLKAIVFGIIISIVMGKVGLRDEASIKNYILYFVAGSVVMFAVTFGYFAFLCRHGKFDASKLAKLSVLGPSVIVTHIILLAVSGFLKDIPEIGWILYFLAWTSTGVTLVTGILYSTGLGIAEHKAECGTLF